MNFENLSGLLAEEIKDTLNHIELPYIPQEAAVLVPLCQTEKGHELLFTKRTETVATHKGQICFPGGVKDETDQTLWETALRETHEEIGMPPHQIKLIGELGKVITPTGFRITPFVASVGELTSLSPNKHEIDTIFSVSMDHLTNPVNFHLEKKTYFDVTYDDPVFTFGAHKIWGATARIVVELLEKWNKL
ncbi:MAG TPA: CoA pyrophosphatase [Deltaproteobacteria bacterium]|nr:MAG: hypothetical protein A2048_04795 [Deltaproteobacteria bacterium GWA2_45_12]HBF13174.1 CoA pyrophosphatase [Deltaproteobacteria bacterium]